MLKMVVFAMLLAFATCASAQTQVITQGIYQATPPASYNTFTPGYSAGNYFIVGSGSTATAF